MDYNDYMYKLVQSFRDNRVNKFMFIKHYETLFISEKEIHDMVIEWTSDICLLFYEFPMHIMQEAYAPFLGWIRELYYSYFKDESPEEFVKNAGVYPLQQPVFVSFIMTNKAKRTVLEVHTHHSGDSLFDSALTVECFDHGRVKPDAVAAVGSCNALTSFLAFTDDGCSGNVTCLVKQCSKVYCIL